MNIMNSNNRIYIYLLVIFFAVFVGTGVFLIVNNKKTLPKQKAVSTLTIKKRKIAVPTSMPTRGFINLKNNSAVNKINSPINLSLIADSDGENVTAFDTIVSYNLASFDFVKADSINQNFKIYSYKGNNSLTLTIVKTGQNSTTIFKGEAVARLVFQSKAKGNFTFAVLSSSGKETTKFVNDKTKIINPEVNQVKVTVN